MPLNSANAQSRRGVIARLKAPGLAAALVLIAIAAGTLWQVLHSPFKMELAGDRNANPWPRSPWKNARLDVKYVGDEACAACHRDLAESYHRHPMGRSLAPIASAPEVGGPRSAGTFSFQSGRSRFTVERRDGREFHEEARLDDQGRVLARVGAEVHYALGSGGRGVSYLVEREGRLFQSPISWYSQQKKWDLSPGYEQRNEHFERPIGPQCLFCHTNRVEPVELSVNRYEEPIFRGHAVGCERRHGPGELHALGQEIVDGKDVTIVNPRHLARPLREAVCEQCHLLGTHRIERPGRGPFDYRPGFPTADFFAVFERADKPRNKAVGHVEQMKASRCYRASEGRLGCTTCHDPHRAPAPEEEVAIYRGRCLDCHSKNGCSLPVAARLAESPDDNCVRCHMPTRTGTDIAHVAVTDHRILKTPGTESSSSPVPVATRSPLVLLNGDSLGPREIEGLNRELGSALTFEAEWLKDAAMRKRLAYLALALLDRAGAERPDDLFLERMRAAGDGDPGEARRGDPARRPCPPVGPRLRAGDRRARAVRHRAGRASARHGIRPPGRGHESLVGGPARAPGPPRDA